MAMVTDWLMTVAQAAPHLAQWVRHMRPSFEIPDVTALDVPWLARRGITAIIWDVDGTLMRYHGQEVARPFRAAFEALRGDASLRHIILSNASEERYRVLGEIFPAVPVLRAYQTPSGIRARRLLHGHDSWPLSPDRMPRALRKPSIALIQTALAELGNPDPSRVAMVGDQYLTDVAGANAAGLCTIKVRTFDPTSFPRSVRLLQATERLWFRLFYTPLESTAN